MAANVELARGAGSRYLVQRWGDGTYCDKTNRKREIEIQVGPLHHNVPISWFLILDHLVSLSFPHLRTVTWLHNTSSTAR